MSEITAAPDRLLTIREAAEWLNVSPITIRRRIAAGELEAVRIGTAAVVRIEPEAVAACLQPIKYPAGAPRTGHEPAVEARAHAGQTRGEKS
jgi:excisionase family DNA binding protein